MKPCYETLTASGWALENGCVEAKRSLYTTYKMNGQVDEQQGKVDFSKRVSTGIVTANVDAQHRIISGSYSIQLNDWTGTVTYSGSDGKGDYAVSNGTANVSGKVLGD